MTDPFGHDPVVSRHDALLSALVHRVDRDLELTCGSSSDRHSAWDLVMTNRQIRLTLGLPSQHVGIMSLVPIGHDELERPRGSAKESRPKGSETHGSSGRPVGRDGHEQPVLFQVSRGLGKELGRAYGIDDQVELSSRPRTLELLRQRRSLVVVQIRRPEFPNEGETLGATGSGDIARSHVPGDLDGHLADRGRSAVDKDGGTGFDLVGSDGEAVEGRQADGGETGGLVKGERVGFRDDVLGLHPNTDPLVLTR